MPGDDAQEKKAREEKVKKILAELEKAQKAIAELSSDVRAARADFEKAEKEVGKS
jgi:hypothetical protein